MAKLRLISISILVLAILIHVTQLTHLVITKDYIATNGQTIRVPVRLYDPIDRFRGNYLRLYLLNEYNNSTEGVYANFKISNGKVTEVYYADEPIEGLVSLLGFNDLSFYLKEKAALKVEKEWMSENTPMELSVIVHDHDFFIKDLYIDGVKLDDWISDEGQYDE